MEESELELETESAPVEWPRYFMRISYDGTLYHGWQRQPNAHSVQSEMESALRKLFRQEKVLTTGCGRTDAGVHARNFYLHFNVENGIPNIDEIMFKLNMMLPFDLAVHSLFPVGPRCHTRFDAIERSYEYHIHQFRDPFLHAHSTYYPWPLDIERMNKAAEMMMHHNDFAAFCKMGGGQKTTICDVRKAAWVKRDNGMIFYITADRFLRNMVRAVVGTLVDVGRHRISVEDFKEILHSGNRSKAGESMAAKGLTLTEVKYPYEVF